MQLNLKSYGQGHIYAFSLWEQQASSVMLKFRFVSFIHEWLLLGGVRSKHLDNGRVLLHNLTAYETSFS